MRRAQNWDGFVATFDDDVVFMPANAPVLGGKDAFKADTPMPMPPTTTR